MTRPLSRTPVRLCISGFYVSSRLRILEYKRTLAMCGSTPINPRAIYQCSIYHCSIYHCSIYHCCVSVGLSRVEALWSSPAARAVQTALLALQPLALRGEVGDAGAAGASSGTRKLCDALSAHESGHPAGIEPGTPPLHTEMIFPLYCSRPGSARLPIELKGCARERRQLSNHTTSVGSCCGDAIGARAREKLLLALGEEESRAAPLEHPLPPLSPSP